MKEYKIAKGWAVFLYTLAPFLLALFGWLFTVPFQNKNFSPGISWILFPVSLAMIVLVILGVGGAYKGRLIIESNSIRSISTLSRRQLQFEEVKGFTVNEKYIVIEPKNRQQKRIRISKYTGGFEGILRWVTQTFPDLEKLQARAEEEDILANENFGLTKESREARLLSARRTAKMINCAAGVAAGWVFFFPTPYQYAMLAAIVVPLLAVLLIKFSDGLIRLDKKKGSSYPSVIYAFILPALGIIHRAIADFNIFDYSGLWLPASMITLSLLLLLLIKQKEINVKKRPDLFTIVSLTLFLFAYSFGTVVHLNCFYDHSDAVHFTSKVLDKRISSGKYTSYYFKLAAWGKQKATEEVAVDKALYDEIGLDEAVRINFRNGRFKIPWFTVQRE